MIPVLRKLYELLAGDAEMAALLSSYEGAPAVFLEVAPEDAQEPYLVVTPIVAVPGEAGDVERLALALDVFDRGRDATRVLQVAARAEKLLDRQRPSLEGRTCVGVFRDSCRLVPEDDADVRHAHVEFTWIYGREDLYA